MDKIFNFSGEFVRRVEFVSKHNVTEAKERLLSYKKIDNQNGSKDYDFTPFAISLQSEKISYKSIATSVSDLFKQYTKVAIETSPEKGENEMFAFGDEPFVLWGGRVSPSSDLVEWLEFIKITPTLSIINGTQLNSIVTVVNSIGQCYQLLLVDLENRQIIDCSNIEEVKKYFQTW